MSEKVRPLLKNWDEVDNKLQNIALNTAKRDEVQAEMNQKLLIVQNKYNDTLDALNREITSDSTDVSSFCKAHEAEFTEQKEKLLNYGKISFRLNPPSLEIKKGSTLEKIIQKIRDKFKKNAPTYIKTTEAINKGALKSLDEKSLKSIDLVKVQTGSFSFETFKKEASENKSAA